MHETTLKWWLRVQETTLTPRQVFAWRKLWTGGLSSSKKLVSGSWRSANQDCQVRKSFERLAPAIDSKNSNMQLPT